MKTSLHLLILFVAILAGTATTRAQSTAFTYQGFLNRDRAPVTGAYDLLFSVYNANTAGGLIAGPLTLNAVSVTNGVFTVTIDFGAGVFTGPARWLEISVRPSGSGSFETLSPRQELTSSPYAIRAGTASDVSNGSVVKSLNSLRDDVSLVAGANVAIAPSGNTLTISSTGESLWGLSGNNAYYDAGNVGIGTATPHHRLGISGGPSWTTAFWQGALALDNASAIGWRANAAGNRFGMGQSGGGLYFFSTASDPGTTGNPANYLMTINDAGNVGIGTSLPATRLAVLNNFYGIEHTDGTVRLDTFLNSSGGWLGTVSNHKLHFYVNDGAPSMTVDTTRNVGIGTATPLTKLHVAGSGLTESTIQAVGERAILALNGFNRTWTLESGVFGQAGLFGIYDRGSGRAPLTIDTTGIVAVNVLRINGGADLSENFDIRDTTDEKTDVSEIEPGMVVSIDRKNIGKLAISEQAYDRRVAGIISGAGGVKPGMLMEQEGSIASGKHPVALTGRVYAHADASFGAIEPGDLLTTSDTPGHAMKVSDHAKAQGAVLGKAMSALDKGRGLVLVLVTLQ